jgi:hypothetical protein
MDEQNDDWHAARLAKKVVGKDASPLKIFTWVIDNHLVPWDFIKPQDVPSPGAVSVLSHIRKSDKNYQAFLNNFAKLLPPRSALEAESRRTDDGRAVFTLLDEAEREFAREGTDRTA